MQREISLASVSWIDKEGIPNTSGVDVLSIKPSWIPSVIYGLQCTANETPSPYISNFRDFERDRQYRALQFCRFSVEIDDSTRQITSFSMLEAFQNGGWTPGFDLGSCPGAMVSWSAITSKASPGERSPISVIYGQRRHENSAIPYSVAEVLVDGVIKFRAGKDTDNLGIKKAGSPYHVPWVWCEMLLTYSDGMFMLDGRGSIFPSHAWYVNGKRVRPPVLQIGDSAIPTYRPSRSIYSSLGARASVGIVVNKSRLNLLPALVTGRKDKTIPQLPLTDDTRYRGTTIYVERHRYTLPGGKIVIYHFS